MSKFKVIAIILLIATAGLGAMQLSASLLETKYHSIMARAQLPSNLSISSQVFERHFFTTDAVTQIQYSPNTSEVINIVITSKALHLPWGISIDSGLVFSSNQLSEQMLKKEFGDNELIRASTSINPLSGITTHLSSRKLNDDRGDFASIKFTFSPEFNSEQQFSGAKYSWAWDGVKLKTGSADQKFELRDVSGSGQFSIDNKYQLLLGNSSIKAKQVIIKQQQNKAIISKLQVLTELGPQGEHYQVKIKASADSADLEQMGFAFDFKQLSLDLLLDSINAKALSSLYQLNDHRLQDPKFKSAANSLLSQGGRLLLNDLSFSLDEGQVDAKIQLELQPGLQLDTLLREESGTELYSRLSANGETRFDRSIVESSDLSLMLLGMKQHGYLSLRDENKKAIATITYKNNILTINNKHFPL